MKAAAEIHLDSQVDKAAITAPAYFNNTQQQTTKNDSKTASLGVLRITNEPTPAAVGVWFGKTR